MDMYDLAARVKQALARKQAQSGQDRLSISVRSGRAGLVWITEDLSKQASRRVRKLCKGADVPVLCLGMSEDLAEHTDINGGKVYTLLQSFPNLPVVLREFQDQLELP